ncbi:hypothetical protein QOT17_011632 [Balamuthia mandrillaris]
MQQVLAAGSKALVRLAIGAIVCTPVLFFVLFVSSAHPAAPRRECKVPTGLRFCTQVNYSTSVADPQTVDGNVANIYMKYRSQQLQTQDCDEAYRGWLCSFYFPKCPYCEDVNGICRSGCITRIARCADKVQDMMASCYTGSLFVDDEDPNGCTPIILPSSASSVSSLPSLPSSSPPSLPPSAFPTTTEEYVCMKPTKDFLASSFCKPNYPVASAPSNHTQVWQAIDHAAKVRYDSFTHHPNATQECLASTQELICGLYFSPCEGKEVLDPMDWFVPFLCREMLATCPSGFKKLCTFNPYQPPDPRQCDKASGSSLLS